MQSITKFLAATAVALVAASASAGISNIQSATIGTLQIRPGAPVTVNNGPSSDYQSDSTGRGAGYAAFSDIAGDSIFFEAGSMSAGFSNASRAVTEVSFDVTGDTPGFMVDRLVSTIFESNFGFYVGDFGEFVDGDGNLVTGCTGANLPNCARTTTGAGFDSFGKFGEVGGVGEVARTEIAFEVLYDDGGGDVVLRKIGGSISMVRNGDGTISFVENLGSGADALSSALVEFGDENVPNYAKVYAWDRSPFEVSFDDPIEFGESAKITYRITADTLSNAVKFGAPTSTNMVVGFACFIDPVGRAGGGRAAVGALVASFADDDLGNPDDATCDDFVQSPGEPPKEPYVLGVPEIRDGTIYFGGGAVPEPATWAMLIAGFGLVGAAARRRRSTSVAA